MQSHEHRNDCYHARRIIRAKPGGSTHKRLWRTATPRIARLVDILPDLYKLHCIAEAERVAGDILGDVIDP